MSRKALALALACSALAACSPGDADKSFRQDVSETRGAATLGCFTNPLTDARRCEVTLSGPSVEIQSFMQRRYVHPALAVEVRPGGTSLSLRCVEDERATPVPGSLRLRGGAPLELRAAGSWLAFLDSPPPARDVMAAGDLVFGVTCANAPMNYVRVPADDTEGLLSVAEWFVSADRDSRPRPAMRAVAQAQPARPSVPAGATVPVATPPRPPAAPTVVQPAAAPAPQPQVVQPAPLRAGPAPGQAEATATAMCGYLRPRVWGYAAALRKGYAAFVASGGLSGGAPTQAAVSNYLTGRFRDEFGKEAGVARSLTGMPVGIPSAPVMEFVFPVTVPACRAVCQDLGETLPFSNDRPRVSRQAYCLSAGERLMLVYNLAP